MADVVYRDKEGTRFLTRVWSSVTTRLAPDSCYVEVLGYYSRMHPFLLTKISLAADTSMTKVVVPFVRESHVVFSRDNSVSHITRAKNKFSGVVKLNFLFVNFIQRRFVADLAYFVISVKVMTSRDGPPEIANNPHTSLLEE